MGTSSLGDDTTLMAETSEERRDTELPSDSVMVAQEELRET